MPKVLMTIRLSPSSRYWVEERARRLNLSLSQAIDTFIKEFTEGKIGGDKNE